MASGKIEKIRPVPEVEEKAKLSVAAQSTWQTEGDNTFPYLSELIERLQAHRKTLTALYIKPMYSFHIMQTIPTPNDFLPGRDGAFVLVRPWGELPTALYFAKKNRAGIQTIQPVTFSRHENPKTFLSTILLPTDTSKDHPAYLPLDAITPEIDQPSEAKEAFSTLISPISEALSLPSSEEAKRFRKEQASLYIRLFSNGSGSMYSEYHKIIYNALIAFDYGVVTCEECAAMAMLFVFKFISEKPPLPSSYYLSIAQTIVDGKLRDHMYLILSKNPMRPNSVFPVEKIGKDYLIDLFHNAYGPLEQLNDFFEKEKEERSLERKEVTSWMIEPRIFIPVQSISLVEHVDYLKNVWKQIYPLYESSRWKEIKMPGRAKRPQNVFDLITLSYPYPPTSSSGVAAVLPNLNFSSSGASSFFQPLPLPDRTEILKTEDSKTTEESKAESIGRPPKPWADLKKLHSKKQKAKNSADRNKTKLEIINKVIPQLIFDVGAIYSAELTFRQALDILEIYEKEITAPTTTFLELKNELALAATSEVTPGPWRQSSA